MNPTNAKNEPQPRPGRSPSQAATLMLALFVFAAIPAVSLAQGLDAAVLAEFMREHSRSNPARDPGPTPRGLKAAVTLAKTLNARQHTPRPRPSISNRIAAGRAMPSAASEPRPAAQLPREALLALPPPAR
ncbi:MAG: hypothetical protein JNK58_14050 [Phycisphaerae bacterium]|nr:hypothetical protein [Phycisphaerae bacterium]